MEISTRTLAHFRGEEEWYEGIIQEKSGRYVLSQGDRHAVVMPEAGLGEELEELAGEEVPVMLRGDLDVATREGATEYWLTGADKYAEMLGYAPGKGAMVARNGDGHVISERYRCDSWENGLGDVDLEDVDEKAWTWATGDV
ncbi:MAG: hypothetical protein ABEI58_01230 [Candidatus Nanohaloarchaea archaeon]